MRFTLIVITALGWAGHCFPVTVAPPRTEVARPKALIDPAAVERSIESELNRKEYDWHLRAEPDRPVDLPFAGLFRSIRDGFYGAARMLRSWWNAWQEFWRKLNPTLPGSLPLLNSGTAPVNTMLWLSLLLLSGVSTALLAWVLRRHRRRPVTAAPIGNSSISPDLTAETVSAADLPEPEWVRLAQEKLGQGDLRLALRAFFLALLSALSARGLIALKRSRSNRDYERELRRRHPGPIILSEFSRACTVFERAWYGDYPAGLADVQELQRAYREVRQDLPEPAAAPLPKT